MVGYRAICLVRLSCGGLSSNLFSSACRAVSGCEGRCFRYSRNFLGKQHHEVEKTGLFAIRLFAIPLRNLVVKTTIMQFLRLRKPVFLLFVFFAVPLRNLVVKAPSCSF